MKPNEIFQLFLFLFVSQILFSETPSNSWPFTFSENGIAKFAPSLADEIIPISPIDSMELEAGEPTPFIWTSLDDYFGEYTLKVIELGPTDPAPPVLPDTGLFYSAQACCPVGDTILHEAPPSAGFEIGQRYAWQAETTDSVSGMKVRGPVVVVIGIPRPSCSITLSGVPTAKLCPGDCFTISGSVFPASSAITKEIRVFTDHPNVSTVGTVTVNSVDAHPLGSFSTPLSFPAHHSSTAGTYSLQICIQEGVAPGPINFQLYMHRPSATCNLNPFATHCCHDDSKTFSVNVADVPNYAYLFLNLFDPPPPAPSGFGISEICSGDPVYFSLGTPTPSGATVQWQYSDDCFTSPPTLISDPIFDDKFTFVVPPNHPALQADCSTGTGYTDRCFRAVITVFDAFGHPCTYTHGDYPLRICCPLTVPQVVVAPSAPLCEGDLVNFNISLNTPDPYVNPPGPEVDIDWSLNGDPVPLAGFHDQPSFTYSMTVPTGITSLCFEAKIKNCGGKLVTASTCVRVDPPPVCGTIQGISASLTPISPPTPPANLAYEICPGDDAQLQATGFMNCLMHWQYSFTPTVPTSWVNMGTSNSIQNTNILLPPGFASIFYRIKCAPLLPNSACDTCYSNIIEVREKPMPPVPVLAGAPFICFGDPATPYTVTNPVTGLTYTWFCNGLEIITGPNVTSLLVNQNACYWVEADDGCYVKESAWLCLAVCQVIPRISCPLPPNDCACLGLEVCLSPLGSTNSCGNPLQFTWSWDSGTYQSGGDINGSPLCHIPDPNGTTYTLIATDPLTGCTAATTYFLKPCDKN